MILLAEQILDNQEYLNKCGIKGQNLASLSNKNINVPDFFIVSSEICDFYLQTQDLPQNLKFKIENLNVIQAILANNSKNADEILSTVSVRSSGVISMPGIMHTYLNVGLIKSDFDQYLDCTRNKPNISNIRYKFLIHYLRNLGVVYDSLFDGIKINLKTIFSSKSLVFKNFTTVKDSLTVDKILSNLDLENNSEGLLEFKMFLETSINQSFLDKKLKYNVLEDPIDQVLFFAEMVFMSSQSLNVNLYKNNNKVQSAINTAIIVQKMVYGDMDGLSGVCFSRNPITGENSLYAEVVFNSQGNDLVSGLKTPVKLQNKQHEIELHKIAKTIEQYYKYPQDIEFTIFKDIIYIMQTRNAKLTTKAQLQISLDMYEENIINLKELINVAKNINIEDSLYSTAQYDEQDIIAHGIPSNPGAIKARIALTNEYVENNSNKYPLCLVRNYTSVDDYLLMTKCKAFITKIGGSTSHASVIARSLNKPAICGVVSLEIYLNSCHNNFIKLHGKTFYEGDEVVIDGANGLILSPETKIINNTDNVELLSKLLALIESKQTNLIEITLNADTYKEIQNSSNLHIKKIGLCRTEHMLVDPKMLKTFRNYVVMAIISMKQPNINEFIHLKDFYLQDLISIQTSKFSEMLEFDLSILVRLFDPPLHEFFQSEILQDLIISIKQDLEEIDNIKTLSNFKTHNRFNLGLEELKSAINDDHEDVAILIEQTISNLQEINPMLGNRGSRLGILLPQLYESQIISIFNALTKIHENQNFNQANTKLKVNCKKISITIPFINDLDEFLFLKSMINRIENQYNLPQKIEIGVMIETVKACFISDKLAQHADYFSFGTNDLTQVSLSISRDDIQNIPAKYYDFWKLDPFQELDSCVKELIKMSINLAKSTSPNIKFSLCGEHARFESNLQFFKSVGIHEISVSSSAFLTTKYNMLMKLHFN